MQISQDFQRNQNKISEVLNQYTSVLEIIYSGKNSKGLDYLIEKYSFPELFRLVANIRIHLNKLS